MRKHILIYLSLMLTIQLSAQSFTKGSSAISFGLGDRLYAGTLFNAYENYSGFNFDANGPYFIRYEYGVSDLVGIGFAVNYSKYNTDFSVNLDTLFNINTGLDSIISGTANLQYRPITAMLRFNFHVLNREKWDLYIGTGVGYRSNRVKVTNLINVDTPDILDGILGEDWVEKRGIAFDIPLFSCELGLGARYMILPNIGIYGEVGFTRSLVNGGIVAQF